MGRELTGEYPMRCRTFEHSLDDEPTKNLADALHAAGNFLQRAPREDVWVCAVDVDVYSASEAAVVTLYYNHPTEVDEFRALKIDVKSRIDRLA